MINKLAYRNAKRSIKDYFLYLSTMIIISALMFAFNSMIFSKDIKKLCTMAGAMAAIIGLLSIFIVIVVSWLINYMIGFMVEKRSREFGIYLLIGMKKKEILSLFMKENRIIGAVAFFLGIIPGIFIQQIITSIFYKICNKGYFIKIDFSILGFLLSLVIYAYIFLRAMRKNKKKIKKMQIKDMMSMDKENEKYICKKVKLKSFLFIVSIVYFIVFNVLVLKSMISLESIWILLAGLIISIYLFYIGISAFLVNYVNKKRKSMYSGTRIFLLRQFISKIKTMQFTMSTLTIIFTFGLLGITISMMFNDYIDKQLYKQVPFDIITLSDDVDDDFNKEMSIINKNCKVKNKIAYNIYRDNTSDINNYLRKELGFSKEDEKNDYAAYFDYDTYIKLSDYNNLREMLGYKEVSLDKNEFIVQAKNGISTKLEEYFKDNTLIKNNVDMKCKKYITDPFSQSGHNGADYIIVVPDEVTNEMEKYYSLLAVDIKGDAPDGLQYKLNIHNYIEDEDEYNEVHTKMTWGCGTDRVMAVVDTILVQTNVLSEFKFMVTSMSFPFLYIAIVFLCVALTVLSVQQISDSAKYKFRYDVMKNLGLKSKEINKVILKQLSIYYLVPAIVSILISSVLAIFMSKKFVYYTRMNTSVFKYFAMACLLLFVVYLLYFVVTYVQFKRNIEK